MGRILMVNVPYAGHTNPTLPLAGELVKRGHKVVYVNAPEFRGRIEAVGAVFVPYKNYPENPGEQRKKMSCFWAAYETACGLGEQFDLLLYEMFFYPGIRIAEKLGIPCVRQFSQPAWNRERAGEVSRFFRVSCKLIDMQVMGAKKSRAMGLRNKNLMDAVMLDRPDLNVVYVPKEFQPQVRSFDSRYYFVIPAAEQAKTDVVIPYGEMKGKILYISLGSIISNRGFCKECIRAFGGKKISVILNTGRIEPKSLGKLPDNVYCYSFVPQIEVLEHADVFLTHCGMNSVNEAMSLGVPMVAMPFINDQISNAKRIVELGIGRKVRSFPSRGVELYRAVAEVLRDKEMRRRCRMLQKRLIEEQSFAVIVTKIEQLMERE